MKSDCWNCCYEVPSVGQELFQLDEPLWVQFITSRHNCYFNEMVFQQSRIMLSRIVEWYNFLKTGTQNCEYNIISTQVDKIDADLEEAIKISTWVSYSKYVFISQS